MKDSSKRKAQVFGSIGVVAVAVLVAVILVMTKEPAGKSEPEKRATLVETLKAESRMMAPELSFRGTLRAAKRLTVPAKVGGEIVWTHENLEVGGIVREGEALARIEKADYEVALQQAQAQLTEARAQLELERGRQSVAEEELAYFERRNEEADTEVREELVLREPQLEMARAGAMRAEAAVRRAELDLERTTIRAPFDGVIEEESVEVGQTLQPGARIAVLLGSQRGLVEARVPARHLDFLRIPGWNAKEPSVGTAIYQMGGSEAKREARTLRLSGSLDPAGRMAKVICEIDDPFGFAAGKSAYETSEDAVAPMLFGAFVELRLPIDEEVELVELPGWILQEDDRVFVMNEEDKLEIRETTVFLRGSEKVYLSEGVGDGERVVTSLIANPIESMALRVEKADSEESDSAEKRNEDSSGS